MVGMHTGAATVENNMEFPQNIKNATAGKITKESQNTNLKEFMHP